MPFDDNTLPPSLPQPNRGALAAALEPGERIISWLETDLDDQLQFGHQLVVLTTHGILTFGAPANGESTPETRGPAGRWPFSADLRIEVEERGGLGVLRMVDSRRLLHAARFTAQHLAAAQRLSRQFSALQALSPAARRETSLAETSDTRLCPACGAALAEDALRCAVCGTGEPAPVAPTRSLLRLLSFARTRKRLVLIGALMTVASTAAGLVPPYLTMPLIDRVLVPQQAGLPVDRSLVIWYLSLLAIAATVAWLLSWAKTFILAWVSERISADLRLRTYSHLQTLSLEFFGGKRTGDLMSRIGTDTDRICYFLSIYLLDFISDSLLIVMTAGVLLAIDPWLALVTLIPLPAMAWLLQLVRGRLLHGFRRASNAWGKMTSVLADTIPGIRVVKAFAQERREIERFAQANAHVLESNDRVNRLWAFFGPTVSYLTELGLLIVWAFGAWRVLQGDVTVGVLTAFIAYIGRFYGRLDSMSRMLAAVQRAAASAHRIFEILDRQPSVAAPAHPVHVESFQGHIEFRHVGFSYGNRPILRDVSLDIRTGEMIGLVGPSGAGKSTFVNLVCRFYDATSGEVLIDGVNIRHLAIDEYRRAVGLVLQESFLFYGTIAENIAYGRPNATRAEIVEAARLARAHEFILRLPDGYDSLVGERGQWLSGGERQRIAIARALLIDPAILVLDEATSAVDNETEREIQCALDNLIEGRTTIAIAHRLSTLRRANRLVVMEQGQIVEQGGHDELLRADGAYARLHRAQKELAESGREESGEAEAVDESTLRSLARELD